MPRTPTLEWKELSPEELEVELKKRPTSDPTKLKVRKTLLSLVRKEEVKAFLDEQGEIQYQHKPEELRHGGR
jgi:hypothetical protein